jgi:hypothetical protein
VERVHVGRIQGKPMTCSQCTHYSKRPEVSGMCTKHDAVTYFDSPVCAI